MIPPFLLKLNFPCFHSLPFPPSFFPFLLLFLILNFIFLPQFHNYIFNQNMSQTLDLKELINVLLNSCSTACQIIEYASKNFILKYKEEDDPVTHIDHTVQKSIVSMIQAKFPGLSIIGEEEVDESMVDSSPTKDQKEQIQIVFPFENLLLEKRQFEKKQLCIFIDPLDCTRGFVNNKKWECTVLIGVTFQGKPILGVIGQPYLQINSSQFIYQPRILVGTSISKRPCAFQYIGGQYRYWDILQRTPTGQETKKVAISSRRATEKQTTILASFQNQCLKCGGSGNKIAMVIRGEVDVTMFIECPTSTWDSCAGEAIVLGMGGFFMKPNLSSIEYEKENRSQVNREGFICTLEREVFSKITQVCGKF